MQATKARYKFLSNTGGFMPSRLLSLLVLSLATSGLLAQSTPQIQEPEPSVQSLLERIQRLEKRIGELEDHQRTQAAVGAESSGPAVVESGNTQSGTVPEQPPEHQHAPNTTAVREAERHYPSLQIRGFGDVDFSATDQKGSVSGFNLGQFVLHFASPLSEKVSYFGELSFTAQPAAYEVQVERSIIRYDYNDYFKISFGKYHTPISYWDTAFGILLFIMGHGYRPRSAGRRWSGSAEHLSPSTLLVYRLKAIFPRVAWVWATTWGWAMGARRSLAKRGITAIQMTIGPGWRVYLRGLPASMVFSLVARFIATNSRQSQGAISRS